MGSVTRSMVPVTAMELSMERIVGMLVNVNMAYVGRIMDFVIAMMAFLEIPVTKPVIVSTMKLVIRQQATALMAAQMNTTDQSVKAYVSV